MKLILMVYSFFLFVVPAQAVRFQPIVEPIGLAEKIVVRGYKGRLQIEPTDSETLKVEAETKGDAKGWSFTVRKVQNQWEIIVKGSSEQSDFEQVNKGEPIPHFDMKVTAPLRAMEVFWNEGEVFIDKWESDFSAQMTKGSFFSRRGKGRYKVQIINGAIDIAEHQGSLDVQLFKGKAQLVKTKGEIAINNHSGNFKISDHDGPIRMQNHSGSVSMIEVRGRALVKNISGVFALSKYSGNFDGDFDKGSLTAKVESLQSFKVTSNEASITLDVPKESGALVSLRSEKGHLWGPDVLRKTKRGRWTERKGRLNGSEQGNIKIISKYGDIVLK